MKTDELLQKEVQDAIKWEPLLKAAEIGVSAIGGIITLTGNVDSYAKKMEAENAAKSVSGVKAVVENIEIKFDATWKITDQEIAAEILNAYKWDWQIPGDSLNIKVENGWITLEGALQWNFQKKAAEKSVIGLVGVKGLTNKITIKSETRDEIEKKDIQQALSRNWSLDKLKLEVQVEGNRVMLKGKVHSLYQKEEAERIAWNTPGVWTIDNQISNYSPLTTWN
jgi:osmotically-inducible protein OsmY